MPVTSLSLEAALQWTQRMMQREWRLLLPVAFAFLALPQLVLGLLLPDTIQAAMMQMSQSAAATVMQAMPWLLPAVIAIQLIAAVGMLAIVALALVPRISVGEALALAARRLWVFVVALLLVAAAEIVVATLLAIVFGLLHVGVASQFSLLVGTILGVALVVSVRLVVLAPVVIGARASPVASIRLAWELTEGAFWRIVAGLLVYSIGGLVVVFASAFTLGALLVLIADAAGSPALGTILSTVYLRLALACFWTGLHVLAAAFYRQLGGSIRGI